FSRCSCSGLGWLDGRGPFAAASGWFARRAALALIHHKVNDSARFVQQNRQRYLNCYFILSRWKARGSCAALVSGLTSASYCSGNGFRATTPQPEPNALMQLLAAINPNPFPRYLSFTSILSRISRSFPRGSQTSCTCSDQSSPSNSSRYGAVSEKLSRTSYHPTPSFMASPRRPHTWNCLR